MNRITINDFIYLWKFRHFRHAEQVKLPYSGIPVRPVTRCQLWLAPGDAPPESYRDLRQPIWTMIADEYAYLRAEDQFNRATGRRHALQRVLHLARVPRENRSAIWGQYFLDHPVKSRSRTVVELRAQDFEAAAREAGKAGKAMAADIKKVAVHGLGRPSN